MDHKTTVTMNNKYNFFFIYLFFLLLKHNLAFCDCSAELRGSLAEEEVKKIVRSTMVQSKVVDNKKALELVQLGGITAPSIYNKTKTLLLDSKAAGERIREAAKSLRDRELNLDEAGKNIFALADIYDSTLNNKIKEETLTAMFLNFRVNHEPAYFALIQSPAHSDELKFNVYKTLENIFGRGLYSKNAWMKPLDQAMRNAGLKD